MNLEKIIEECGIPTDGFDEGLDDGLAEIDIEFAIEHYGDDPEFVAYLERLNDFRQARRENMQKVEEMKILLGLEDYDEEVFDETYDDFELEITENSYTLITEQNEE